MNMIAPAASVSATRTINVLAYVHLRNIYRSTGAGRVARELIEHVARRDGVNIHILGDRADHRAIVHRVGEPWTGFDYHLFPRDTSRQQALWVLTHRPSARRFWPDADVVHCTGESYVPASGCKLIVTAHDAAYFDRDAHPRGFATYKQTVKWRLLYATLSRTADLFHTVSHFSAERLAAAFPAIRSRLRVIHNGVAARFFEAPGSGLDDFLNRFGLRGKRLIFVPNGLQYRKNADLILDAWPVLKNSAPGIELVVGGHCTREYIDRARQLTSVTLTGFLEDDDLCAAYHAASIVWFPSRYEGFGLPVLEAMACGTPVVASNSTSIPEVAGDAALLASPSSVNENVEAIRACLDDESVCTELKRRGLKRAAQFTWGAAAARLHDLYLSLM